MCGIAGTFSKNHGACLPIYEALSVIQHRGQDAAGIATCENGRLHMFKEAGLVRDVFDQRAIDMLAGNIGVGHVRYPTAGTSSCDEAQPFYVNSPYGIVLAHNGNLTNAKQLTEELGNANMRHLNTNSDSEVLLNILAHELAATGKLKIGKQDIFKAVRTVHQRCQGAYACVAMIVGKGLIGFRDPYGIRPLVIGKRPTPDGFDYMLASESVALDALGFQLIRDVQPGEAVFIDMAGHLHMKQCAEETILSPCVFEFVYLARPESLIDGVSVYKSRLRMGETLAAKIMREMPKHDIDVVIPIPETSRTSALPIAYALGVKYREGFIKNRYIGRTFIMPGQQERQNSIKKKLNAIPLEFEGKTVLLVDDSIVRGNTSRQIVQMAREAGAKKVYFASASPPVRHQNVYGIDMPASSELIAHGRTEEEVCAEIGADQLFYQDLDDLVESVFEGNPNIKGCDTSCFDGRYITQGVTEEYLREIEEERNDSARLARDASVAKAFNGRSGARSIV